MRSLCANIYKDICLFLTGRGLVALLLPVLFALGLLLGLNDTADASRAVKPFPIAVFDRDATLMSGSLLTQLRRVSLFSSVRAIDAEGLTLDENGDILPAEGLFSSERLRGFAALVTIPKDFFYDAYTENEAEVRVILNGEMPLESALTSTLVGSVAGILKSERAAWFAAYLLKNGGEAPDGDADYLRDTANGIVESALGRLAVFKNDAGGGMARSVKNTFFACAVSMLMLLVSIGVLKTLPDERRLSLSERYASLGGSFFQLIVSKAIAAFVFFLLGAAPLAALLQPEMGAELAPMLIAAFAAGFSAVLVLSRVCGESGGFMLCGALFTAAELILGGAIYPSVLLPKAARLIGGFTIPGGLIAYFEGQGAGRSSALLFCIAAIGSAAFALLELLMRGTKKSRAKRGGTPC